MSGMRAPLVHGRRGRWLVLFAIVMAFCWQTLLAGTHTHFEPRSAPIAFSSAGKSTAAAPAAPTDQPSNCPICRDLALAAHYPPPVPLLLEAPASAATTAAPPAQTIFAPLQRSHSWRSRGPPNLIQA